MPKSVQKKALFLVIFCSVFLPKGELKIDYYVTRSTHPIKSSCKGHQPCHTLDQYAINSSQLFHRYTNYTLVLSSGVHVLTSDLVISDIGGLEMCSDPSGATIATIDITHGKLNFHNISSLVFSKIEVVRASEWKYKQPDLWLSDIPWVKLNKIQLINVSLETFLSFEGLGFNFTISNSGVQNSSIVTKLKMFCLAFWVPELSVVCSV